MNHHFRAMRHSRTYIGALFVGACALAISLSSLSSDRSTDASASPPADAYSVLSRPETAADSVDNKPVTPARLAQDMPAVDAKAARVLPDNARRTVALVPRRDGKLCLAVFGGNGYTTGTCAERTAAITEGLVAGVPGAQVGVAPDGVREVTYRMTDGSNRTGAVTSNVYWPPAEAAAASFVSHGKSRSIELTPQSELQEQAAAGVTVRNAPYVEEVLSP